MSYELTTINKPMSSEKNHGTLSSVKSVEKQVRGPQWVVIRYDVQKGPISTLAELVKYSIFTLACYKKGNRVPTENKMLDLHNDCCAYIDILKSLLYQEI